MTGVVTATILNGQKELKHQYEVLSIDVAKNINRIPYAQLVFVDGDAAKSVFPLSDTNFFEPGQTIEIRLHYEEKSKTPQKAKTVFKGIVIHHSLQVNIHHSLLTVELKDAAIALTTQRKNFVFSKGKNKIKDSAIFKEILQNAKKYGVEEDTIKPTPVDHTEMVQFCCTDWDFILSRAEANGHWVRVEDGKISMAPPDLSPKPKRSFKYGTDNIYEFETDADIQHLCGVVEGTAWDETKQTLFSSPKQAKAFSIKQGNLSPKTLADKIGAKQCDLITSSALNESEVQTWADAQMIKGRLSMVRGRIQVPGFADIHLGDVIELGGMGARFNGKTLVTGVRHQVSSQGWVTDIQYGMSAHWFTHSPDITDVPAAGLLPAVNGLQVGIVDKYEADPDEKLRVRVKIPTLEKEASKGMVWARLTALDAGANRGTFFRPELGDEVILGFLNDDPRQAIILGSLHSKKNQPPWEITEKNEHKGIVTQKNLKLCFNDEDKKETITIETPGGNKIILTEESDKGIEIIDMNKNSVVMNSNGIEITSCKDMVINAESGEIILKGKNITLQGDSVDVK